MESLGLSPSGEDFTLLNPPQYPFTLPAGDTMSLAIQANPGIARTPHRVPTYKCFRRRASRMLIFRKTPLTLSVNAPPVLAPLTQSLILLLRDGLLLRSRIRSQFRIPAPQRSGGYRVLHRPTMPISLQSNVSFPDTIHCWQGRPSR